MVLGTACEVTEEDVPTPTGDPGAGVPVMVEEGVPGVSDSRILFGQSAAFSGPAQALGQAMRLGIQTAFHEQNEKGGVYERMLELTTLDDQYEPHLAYSNTLNLINREHVFALIGEVGTPTSRSASPLANAENVPFIAPFTGADFLRESELENVVNLRASYHQEAEEMVARLTEDLGITRVAVMYQNDSYGQSGLDGVVDALRQRGLEPVAYWYYQRNSDAVKAAVFNIVEANPEAIIMIGAYAPVAKAITVVREDIAPIFMAVSFVGSNALAQELGPDGVGVYVTQVVPLPDDTSVPAVVAYRAALKAFDANAVPGFVSLEGYLAGRLAIVGLEKCGRDVSRDCFLDVLRNSGTIDLNGLTLQYGPGDNQGSDAVFVTVIGDDGKYHLVNSLAGAR
ncbi:MAG: ABC transporter substrate-binding protein [Actinomycetia bacterium]|nr:ABC transporter substrate-binding protein [Actinomycetes bacterium]